MGTKRGMKTYLPFSSLIEQQIELDKMIYQKSKIDKPQVSNEQANKIDRILRNFDKNTEYNFKIYLEGYLYLFKSKIYKLDIYKKEIYFEDFKIPIRNIIDIDDPNNLFDVC